MSMDVRAPIGTTSQMYVFLKNTLKKDIEQKSEKNNLTQQ